MMDPAWPHLDVPDWDTTMQSQHQSYWGTSDWLAAKTDPQAELISSPEDETSEYFATPNFHGPHQTLSHWNPIQYEQPTINQPSLHARAGSHQPDMSPQSIEEADQETAIDDTDLSHQAALRSSRKPRARSDASSAASQPSLTPSSGSSRKHERNREKNRLAASKCREKSKKHVDDLREREQELAAYRNMLSAEAAELKNEVLWLKNEVLRHGECDCDFIQNYLNNAARHVV